MGGDAAGSAHLYTWLVVSIPANRVAFLGDAATYTPAELEELADEATRVFLAAHSPDLPRQTGGRSRRRT